MNTEETAETPEQKKARISAARRAAALKSAEVRRRNSKRNQQPTETPEQKQARISRQCREAALKSAALRHEKAKKRERRSNVQILEMDLDYLDRRCMKSGRTKFEELAYILKVIRKYDYMVDNNLLQPFVL